MNISIAKISIVSQKTIIGVPMLLISLDGLDEQDKTTLPEKLKAYDGEVIVLLCIPDFYSSTSLTYIAEARLSVWYLAETFADMCDNVRVEEKEGEFGAGDIRFSMTVRRHQALASKLLHLTEVFDPESDGLDAAEFGDEITDWVEKRNGASRFPDLQDAYEIDAEAARDYADDSEEME